MDNRQLALTGQQQVANEGERIYKQWFQIADTGERVLSRAHCRRTRSPLRRAFLLVRSLPRRATDTALRSTLCGCADRDGRITGPDAVRFFQRSGLPRETLSRGPCPPLRSWRGTCWPQSPRRAALVASPPWFSWWTAWLVCTLPSR